MLLREPEALILFIFINKNSGVKYQDKNLKDQRSREQPPITSYLFCSSNQKGLDPLSAPTYWWVWSIDK